jgi:hypothetical protein
LELENFGAKSKNEIMEMQTRYFDPTCYLVFICKTKKYRFQNFLPSFSISNQMELLDFLIDTCSFLLVSFSKTIVHKIVIWTWKSSPKVSQKTMLVFGGWG